MGQFHRNDERYVAIAHSLRKPIGVSVGPICVGRRAHIDSAADTWIEEVQSVLIRVSVDKSAWGNFTVMTRGT